MADSHEADILFIFSSPSDSLTAYSSKSRHPAVPLCHGPVQQSWTDAAQQNRNRKPSNLWHLVAETHEEKSKTLWVKVTVCLRADKANRVFSATALRIHRWWGEFLHASCKLASWYIFESWNNKKKKKIPGKWWNCVKLHYGLLKRLPVEMSSKICSEKCAPHRSHCPSGITSFTFSISQHPLGATTQSHWEL